MTDVTKRLEPLHRADWLALAAAPTFALMAVVTGILDSGAHQMPCSAAMHMSPVSGMVLMYVLMSGFHLTPWLKLFPLRRVAEGPTAPSRLGQCVTRTAHGGRGLGSWT